MHARFASGVFLALGLADLAVLNLLLAPKLREARVNSESAVVAAPPEPTSKPITKPEREPPKSVVASVPPRQGQAAPDVRFSLQSELVTSIEAAGALDRLAIELAADSSLGLVLRGHADKLGRPEHNLVLSRRRAESVKRYLVMRGAPGDRIDVEAAGDTEPLDPDDTPLAWSKNRRVEVRWREAPSR